MTDNEKRAHDIAVSITKIVFLADVPNYKPEESNQLVVDFVGRYKDVYDIALEQLKPNKWVHDERWS